MSLIVKHRCPACGTVQEFAAPEVPVPGLFPFEHCKGVFTEEVGRRLGTLTIGKNGKLTVEPPWMLPDWHVDPDPIRYAESDARLTMRMWRAQHELERTTRRERVIDAVILAVIIALSALYFWAVIQS